MNRFSLHSVAISAFLIVGVTACAPPSKEDQPPKPKVTAGAPKTGEVVMTSAVALPKLGPAPAWKLKDVNGREVNSEQFKGKVVVVDFWATWCPPCRAEVPGYTELQTKYGRDGVVIVGISLDEAGPGVVKAFADKFRVNYPMVMADEAVVTAFGVDVLPTTFLIDRSGQIRHRKDGAEETAEYEKKLAAVLAEKA